MKETHLALVKPSKLDQIRISPRTLVEFVGQTRLKDFVSRLIAGTKSCGSIFPASLIIGPSGWGKTTLVKLLSDEISSKDFRSITASPDMSRNDICSELADRTAGQLLYIDEAHALPRPAQEAIYGYLDTGVIPQPGESKTAASIQIRAPRGPIIFSTNYPGKLQKELRNRLTMLELDDYSEDDLKALCVQALDGNFEIEEGAVEEIVQSAHGSPRAIINALRELVLITQGSSFLKREDVQKLFSLRDVGPTGLPKSSHDYIEFLGSQPEGRARLYMISQRFGVDQNHIRNEIEPVLIRYGLMIPSPHGRALSRRGIRYYQTHIQPKGASNEI